MRARQSPPPLRDTRLTSANQNQVAVHHFKTCTDKAYLSSKSAPTQMAIGMRMAIDLKLDLSAPMKLLVHVHTDMNRHVCDSDCISHPSSHLIPSIEARSEYLCCTF